MPSPYGPLHDRITAMRMRVPTIDTMSDPRHPSRLEKNPNMTITA